MIRSFILAAAAALALCATPGWAEDSDVDKGLSLMERGTTLLLRGLMDRVEPELQALVDEMQPAIRELEGLIGNIGSYHAPEVLPNGDIIIRRRVPLLPERLDGDIEI